MATLTIASKNYGSWSLRGWLLCKMAGLEFDEQQANSDDPSTRAELLRRRPTMHAGPYIALNRQAGSIDRRIARGHGS